ncbi:MAG: dihydropteroate synthase [Frankiaceae bacterium]|nr:dihydropteroate synthase [Frankiaceae bacterium]
MRSDLPHPELTDIGRCRVMGVVNVTPDSFSDGGTFVHAEAAIAHGLAMAADGADIVDVGGESTRPGAAPVEPAEEWRRVGPVVTELAAAGLTVSIDTMHRVTAEKALNAGARIVNDVSGGLNDADLPRLVADAGVPYVVMHWRARSADMQSRAVYDDVVSDVCRELSARVDALLALGISVDQLVLDPGLGFAKTAAHNWSLLAQLDVLLALGRPLLVGASRKSFLGGLLADPDGTPRPADGRDDATTALTALVAARGAWAVRVHDVAASRDAVEVVAALGRLGR